MQTELDGFEEFWKVFPRRVGKQAAIRAFQRALKMTTTAKIIDSAKRYAADRRGQEPQFTKHPATWLNAGCWGDYETDLTAVPRSQAVPTQCYVRFEDREAWDAYGRTHGKSYPRDKSGGWWFPSPVPPSMSEAAE